MPRYSEAEARAAIAGSHSYAEALRRVGLRPAGGNHALFRKYVDQVWRIDTSHFDPYYASRRSAARARGPRPLEKILVTNSRYNRAALKARLYEAGLKQPVCELCGQDENWKGRRMALIIDHINGVPDDNRIENLQIVCPNCAATLDTHCARKNRLPPLHRECARCGRTFLVKRPTHRYCSLACGSRWDRREAAARGRGQLGSPKPGLRKVRRPPYDQLLREIAETSYLAVGRKYGVSDNAIRKWVRFYERQMEREAAQAERGEAVAERLDEAA